MQEPVLLYSGSYLPVDPDGALDDLRHHLEIGWLVEGGDGDEIVIISGQPVEGSPKPVAVCRYAGPPEFMQRAAEVVAEVMGERVARDPKRGGKALRIPDLCTDKGAPHGRNHQWTVETTYFPD